METILTEKPGLVKITEIRQPKLQKGYALMKMVCGGICGSDLGVYKGTFAYAGYPRVPGHEITDGNGFDITVEAVGLPQTFQNAVDSAAFGGRVVLIGISKQNLDFGFTEIQRKELSILGSRNALKVDFLELIDLVKSGKISVEGMVTSTFPFRQAAEAFHVMATQGDINLKIMLEF